MTQQKQQTPTTSSSKRAASPHTNPSSPSGKETEPPKKRGRTTRRSLAIQAEEDAIAAAKDREEQEQEQGEGDDGGEEEGEGEGDGGSDKKKKTKVKKTEKDDDDDEQKVKVKEEADTDSMSKVKTKPQPQDDDKSSVKKEEDTEDKKPLHLEIPQHMVLEKGHAYFFYRPKIDIGDKQKPKGTEDVQKLYMLLSPEAAVGRVSTLADSKQEGLASSGKKSEEKEGSDGDKDGDGDGSMKLKKEEDEFKKEDGGGAMHRLLIISRKALPTYQSSNTTGSGSNPRGNRPGARNWAFVDTASSDLAKVESRLREYSYTTKTRGERTQAAARFIAQARYEVVLDHVDPEHPQRQSSHLVYELEVPTTPGPVQEAFKIAKEGQFLVHVKNPRIQTPATERGAVRYATLKDKAATLPQHLQERFRGVRKDEVRYAPMDTCEFLDVNHTELVLLGVKRGAREEFEDVLKGLEEDVEDEVHGWSESESEAEEGGGGGLEQVYKELDVDEATIPAAVDEFK